LAVSCYLIPIRYLCASFDLNYWIWLAALSRTHGRYMK